MLVPRILTKIISRRSFLQNSVLAGGGLLLSTIPTDVMASDGTNIATTGGAEIGVRTGWNRQAVKVLARKLNSHKGSPKFVSSWHRESVVVPDSLARRQLATIAMNNSLETEYFVAMSRTSVQPTSDAEAAQIVHNLGIWQMRRATIRDGQAGNVAQKIYGISFRDSTLIRNSIHFAVDSLSQTQDIVRYYHTLTV